MRLLAPPAGLCLIGAVTSVAALSSARADWAAITSQNADMLSIVDTDHLTVRANAPLPGKPAAVAVDGPRGRIMAIATETGRLHVFDMMAQPLGDWAVPGQPFALALRESDGMVLVSGWQGDVYLVDPTTGEAQLLAKTGLAGTGIAVDDTGEVIVLANRDDDRATILKGNRQIQVPTGSHPFGVTLYGGRAWVTNVYSDDISVIDLENPREIARIATGSRPYALGFAAGKGFVTNQYSASLTVFDPETYQIISEIAVDDYPEGISASSDGRRIYVACWFTNSLLAVDADSLEVLGGLDLPDGPRAFGHFIAAKQP